MAEPKPGLLCPSAQPDMAEARVIGLVSGTPEEPQIAYLAPGVHVDPSVASNLGGLDPGHVFRFAARCEQSRCSHFEAGRCSLAERIVAMLPVVVDALPACSVRPSCRWFAEQGGAACRRCPQVLTLAPRSEDAMTRAAQPPGRALSGP
jgi:hypothetical protein